METKNVKDNHVVINSNEIITNNTIAKLKNTFSTPESYLHHMKVLETARALIYSQIEKNGWDENTDNELFPLFNTLNLLYGAFWERSIEQICEESIFQNKGESITIKI